MSKKVAFQYAVLRYIHDAFTGEFLNVGLAFYCHEPALFKVRLLHKYSRLTGAFPTADGEYYRRYISALQRKLDQLAAKVNSDQATLEPWLPDRIDELLDQVLPRDDSSIQFAKAQGGTADDAAGTFEELYHRLVESYLPREELESHDEAAVWNVFSRPLRELHVYGQLRPTFIHAGNEVFEFEHAWRNGRWKALEPVSFDLLNPGTIRSKALRYFGQSVVLESSREMTTLYYLLGRPRRSESAVQNAYSKAKDLLGTGQYARKVRIIEEDQAEDFAREIAPKIAADTAHEAKG